ncbi:hypothetical protein COW46_04860 [Candidatus Gracilibacteria bacterium CG17_big_fil_post_rev_8_21_14_2_50_48_13]|nr:MAG: hypothetical protein COW46_04860 [Candidatus Gracilibacteria bacterium CG17_big_fil_post_rev_8_21_14_2_50_48_13]
MKQTPTSPGHLPEDIHHIPLMRGNVHFDQQVYPFFHPIVANRSVRGPSVTDAEIQRQRNNEALPLKTTETILTALEAGFPIVFSGNDRAKARIKKDLSFIAAATGMRYRQHIDGAVRNKELLALLRRAYAGLAEDAYATTENQKLLAAIDEEYLRVSESSAMVTQTEYKDEMDYLKAQAKKAHVLGKGVEEIRDMRQKTLYVIENFSALSEDEQQMLLHMAEPEVSGSLEHLYLESPTPALCILRDPEEALPHSLMGNRPLLFTGYKKEHVKTFANLEDPTFDPQHLAVNNPTMHIHKSMAQIHDALFTLDQNAESPLEVSLIAKVRQMLISYTAANPEADPAELLGIWAERLEYIAQHAMSKRTTLQTKILENLLRKAQSHVGKLPKVIGRIRKSLERKNLLLEHTEDHKAIAQHFHQQIRSALHTQGVKKQLDKINPLASSVEEVKKNVQTLIFDGHIDIVADAFMGIDLSTNAQTDGQEKVAVKRSFSALRHQLAHFDPTAFIRSGVGTVENTERLEILRRKLRASLRNHHQRLRPNYRMAESEQMLEEQRKEQLATLPDIVEYLALHFSVLRGSSEMNNAEARDTLRNIFAELRDDIAPLETLCDLGLESRPLHPRSGESEAPVYTKNNLHAGFANRAAPELRAYVQVLPQAASSEHNWDVWTKWIAPEFEKDDIFPLDMTALEREIFKNNLSAHIDIATLYFASMVGDTSIPTEVQRRAYLHTHEEIQQFVESSWNPVLRMVNERRVRSDMGPLPDFSISALMIAQITHAFEALLMLSYSGATPQQNIATRDAVDTFKQKHYNNDMMLGYIRGFLKK